MDETAGAVLVRYQLVQVRQRWRVVAAMGLVGLILAACWSLMTSTTTWTATTALSSQSQERSPEQDAVLALGYVNYFNQATYQELLRTEAKIPPGVSLTAQAAATSPILYIQASGPSEDAVRIAATTATDRFRDDVYRSLSAARQRAAADLQAQVDANTAHLGQPGYNDAVVLDQIRSLQGRITDTYADNTNQIKELQNDPGVISSSPSALGDLVTGALGGALVGVLAAVLLGLIDPRVRTRADVTARTGLKPAVDVYRGAAPADRRRRLGNLTNAITVPGSTGPVVLAVVAPRRSAAASALARELADEAASRPAGALLVHTDLDEDGSRADPRLPGLADVLHRRAGAPRELTREASEHGVPRNGDSSVSSASSASSALVAPDRMADAVAEFSAMVGLVVVDAPALLEAAESQVVCAAADHVLLVAERGVTVVADLAAARDLLADVHVRLSGTVLDDPVPEDPAEPDGDVGDGRTAHVQRDLPDAGDADRPHAVSVSGPRASDRT